MPGAELESHGLWVARLAALARSVQGVALAVLGLVAGVAMAVVAVATRAGLAARREAIGVLHDLGATDAGHRRALRAAGGDAGGAGGARRRGPGGAGAGGALGPRAAALGGRGDGGRGAGGGALGDAGGAAAGGRRDRLGHGPGHRAALAEEHAVTGALVRLPARGGWRRRGALALGAALLASLGLGLGFLVFVLRAAGMPAGEAGLAAGGPAGPAAGAPAGIAVLTGGPERVEAGLGLLMAREGGRLIVSGVGPEAGLGDLARRAGLEAAELADRTDLGREATSTRGNAREVAAWARAGGIREITVVTAGFHMPRALLELRRALPEAALRPHPVPPFVARPLPMLREYLKLVGAGLGLSVLVERPRRILP